uniref:Uncharacterized protein n=1 Tax=Arundo donax TaxID=35708 RepID=A0A0A9AYZ5_ARUDO
MSRSYLLFVLLRSVQEI